MIEVLFFARFREALALDGIAVPAEPGLTAHRLRQQLADRGPEWAAVLGDESQVMVALNEQLVSGAAELRDGDTVAFFPPVTGG